MLLKHLHAATAYAGALAPFEPFTGVCNIEGEGDPGGGGEADPAPRTFTQDEVTALVGREVSKAKSQFRDYDTIREKAGQVDDLTAKYDALQLQFEDAGKTAEEKERARASRERETLDRKLAALEQSRAEHETALEAERTAHRQTRASHDLMSALTGADVHPKAAGDALRALMAESELEYGEDGALAAITLRHNGMRHGADALAKAAADFLEAKPYFAKGAPGGAGTRPPNGGGSGGDGRPLHELSPAEALRLDAQRRSARAR